MRLIREPSRPLVVVAATAAGTGRRPSTPRTRLIMELPTGQVVIKLRPDLAPNHVARIKELDRGRLLRRHAVPSRHRRLHGAGRRPDRHRHRRLGPARPQGGVHPDANFEPRHDRRGAHRRVRTRANSQFFICFEDARS